MLKELSFNSITALLKYLVLVIILSGVGVLYSAKLDHAEPDSVGAGVVTGRVRTVVSTSVPLVKESQAQADQSKVASDKVRLAFQAANEAIRQGNSQTAKRLLAELIDQHPALPEPYLNLASLQAADGQLIQARTTLLQGLQANQGYAAVFAGLQKVQGALAANAYRAALTDQAEDTINLDLPLVENINRLEATLRHDSLSQASQVSKHQAQQEAGAELQEFEQEFKAN